MARSIRKRLDALEGAAYITPNEGEGDQDGLVGLIAEAERKACLMSAWVMHNSKRLAIFEPISSVLPKMLRYVDEAEARRLLALDYKSFYSAARMPNHDAAKLVQEAKPEERARPKIRVPGRVAR